MVYKSTKALTVPQELNLHTKKRSEAVRLKSQEVIKSGCSTTKNVSSNKKISDIKKPLATSKPPDTLAGAFNFNFID